MSVMRPGIMRHAYITNSIQTKQTKAINGKQIHRIPSCKSVTLRLHVHIQNITLYFYTIT